MPTGQNDWTELEQVGASVVGLPVYSDPQKIDM